MSVNKITGLENWLPIDEDTAHSEGVADFFMLIHNYVGVLTEMIKDDTIKDIIHSRIDLIFQESKFSTISNFFSLHKLHQFHHRLNQLDPSTICRPLSTPFYC